MCQRAERTRSRTPPSKLAGARPIAARSQADWCVADKNRYSRRGELRLNGHQVVHQKFGRFEKLVHWLGSVDPARVDAMQKVRRHSFRAGKIIPRR